MATFKTFFGFTAGGGGVVVGVVPINDADEIYVGALAADAVYYGTALVWGSPVERRPGSDKSREGAP
jgi:hypothetical protein